MGILCFFIKFFRECRCKPVIDIPLCTELYESEDSESSSSRDYSDAYYNIYINRQSDDF